MVLVGDPATADWANRRPASASGTVTITPTAVNTPATADVTFPAGRFATPPAVTVTQVGNPGTFVAGLAAAPTTDGVTIAGIQSSGALVARVVHWTAIEST